MWQLGPIELEDVRAIGIFLIRWSLRWTTKLPNFPAIIIINARRMRTSVTVLHLCVCVRSLVVSLHDKLSLPVSFTLVFLDFGFADFDKKLSYRRYSSYFVIPVP